MKSVKKKILESSFFKVFSIILKNPATYFYTIVLDFVLLALIVFIGKYIGSFIPLDPEQLFGIFKTTTNLLLFAVIYPTVYYLFVIFIYSITKLSILNLIKKLFDKSKFSLKGLGKFYLLNVLIFVIFLFSGLILLAILSLILQQDFLKYVVLILSVPFLFFLYSTINITHTLFIKNEKDKLIKKALKTAFSRINKYGMFIVWNILLTLIYLLLYNIIHLLFRLFVFSNQEILINYGSTYLKIFNIASLIFIYALIAFNRLYFYNEINKNVLQ